MKTIYYHGMIETMDEDLPQATALCIENGRIAYVGDDHTALHLKEDNDIVIDLEGKTMLPGFIDPHSHFTGLANSLSQCDLSEAKSYADIISLMKAFMEREKPAAGEWVFGSNYDHNFLEEKAHPDKQVLNQISTTHPIVIVHASSHMGVVNDAALAAQNLTEDISDPEGGRYGRYDNGELNGYMEENAFIHFQNNAPMISVERLMQLMVKAQDIYASYGITTIQEGMVAKPLFQLSQYASSQGLLQLDVVGYIDIANSRALLKENEAYTKNYINHLKIGGYKVFLDGSPQGRTAWMREPYAGETSYCGYPVHSDEKLEQFVKAAVMDGMQLLAHCNGDGAAEQYIRTFEKVHAAYPAYDTCRPVMVHAQLVGRDQLKRMIPLKMMPSFFVAHTYFWGDIHIENFGFPRASRISPAGTANRLGIPFTFHQDSPVLMPDMLKTVACAVSRKTRKGVLLDQNECVSVKEALKAITINGAYQYFEENDKGSITSGKIADLVILDCNPLTMPKEEIANIQVLTTIKEGKTIYQK